MPDELPNKDNVDQFKSDCLIRKPEEVVQQHLIDGSSYFFDTNFQRGEEFLFKKGIAESLNVHIRDIVIIGSGKLGFSIKPDSEIPGLYRFKKFDYDYCRALEANQSDLDVAIVSSDLFDQQLRSVYEHTDCYLSHAFSSQRKKNFSYYVLKGWIRPDFLPDGYKISPQIDEAKQLLTTKYGRDVNIGIYKSWYYFEQYHVSNIKSLTLNLMA